MKLIPVAAPWRAIGREAIAGLVGGGRREAFVWALVALIIGSGMAADTSDVAELSNEQRTYAAQGGYLLSARAETSAIDAHLCHSLNNDPNIVAAAAVDRTIDTPLLAAPSAQIQFVQATNGILAIDDFGPQDRADAPLWDRRSALAGPYLTQRLNLPLGHPVTIVSATGPETLQLASGPISDERLGGALILQRPPAGTTTECLIRTEPWAFDVWATGALEAAVQTSEQAPVSTLTDRPAIPFSIQARDRDGPWLALASGLLAGLLVAVTWYFRRSDAALYGSLGMSRTAIGLLFQIRSVVATLALVGATGVCIQLLSFATEYEFATLNLRQLAVIAPATLAVQTTAAIALGLSTHFDALKDR